MARRAATVAFALLMFLASSPEPASSQSDGDPVTLGTYRVFRSEILGEDRVLQVRLPREYDASVLDYPVVYLFYSDWVELYYAEAVNTIAQLSANLMPQVILVGVPNTDRYRDLYPWPRADGWGGEADRFLRFVREELFPFIDSEYRTKDYRVMVGPQAAAVFGVYALLEAPQARGVPCRKGRTVAVDAPGGSQGRVGGIGGGRVSLADFHRPGLEAVPRARAFTGESPGSVPGVRFSVGPGHRGAFRRAFPL